MRRVGVTMPERRTCQGCATELEQEYAEQLCPKCLLKAGLEQDQRSAGLHIRCPHCHQPVEVVADDPLIAIDCPSCGSSFNLSTTETASYGSSQKKSIGHFELLDHIGTGHFGSVWKARDTELDRTVAVKIPRQPQLDYDHVEQFLREARAAAQLNHSNIVSVHEVGREDGQIYIVSDLVDGVTLTDWLTAEQPTPREAAEMCSKIADALHHAHESGVIHRDLKPSNIMLDVDGEPHIMDFGLAKREAGEITVTVEGKILGTPAYMSPEQARGEAHQADRRSDVYSLGVILFELLTGERPFRGNQRMLLHQVISEDAPSPRKLNNRVPRDLETICLKCLEKQSGNRYENAKAVADELRRFLKGQTINARPVSKTQKMWRWCKRNPVLSGMSAALLVSILVGASVASKQWLRAEVKAEENRKRLVNVNLANGIRLQNIGDSYGALPWFVEALRLDQKDPEREGVHRLRLGMVLHNCPKLTQMWFHESRITHAEFSRDGKKVVVACGDGTARIYDANDGELVATVKHSQSIDYASFSNDSSLLATASDDHTARIWNSETGEPVTGAIKHDDHVTKVVFLPGDEQIITWASIGQQGLGGRTYRGDYEARLWDAKSGQALGPTFRGDKIKLRKDRRRVLTINRFFSSKEKEFWRRIEVWDVTTGDQVAPPIEDFGAFSASFSADPNTLVLNTKDGVQTWDISKHAKFGQSFKADGRLSIGPNAKRILSVATSDLQSGPVYARTLRGRLRVWNVESGSEVTDSPPESDRILFAEFSPDGGRFFTVDEDRTVRIRESTNGRLLHPAMHHSADVKSVEFSPNGSKLIVATTDRIVRLWDLVTNENEKIANAFAFSPDGRFVVTTDGLWDRSLDKLTSPKWEGSEIPGFMVLGGPYKLMVTDVAIRRDLPVEANADGSVVANFYRIWNATTGKSFARLGQIQVGEWVSFNPKGDRLITAAMDDSGTFRHYQARVWDARTGNPITPPLLHDEYIVTARFSPDGRQVVTASFDGTARVWDAETGQPITLVKHGSIVEDAKFSPDGNLVVTAGRNNTARIWNVKSGGPVGQVLLHLDEVDSVSFSTNGEQVVTASADGTARIWDVHSTAPLTPSMPHAGPVLSASFSANGHYVVTCAKDWSARIWDARTGDPITPSLQHDGQVERAVFTRSNEVLTKSVPMFPDGNGLLERREVRVYKLRPVTGSLPELNSIARLMSGRMIESSGSLAFVQRDTMRDDWQAVRHLLRSQLTARQLAVAWHQRMTEFHRRSGDWFAAAWHAKHLIDIEPSNTNHIQLARIHALSNKLGKAKEVIDQVLSRTTIPDQIGDELVRAAEDIDPDYTPEPFAAKLLFLNAAIELKPNDWRNWTSRGSISWFQEHYEAASRDFTRAIQLGCDDCRAWDYRSRCRIKLNDLEGAIADLSKAIELGCDDEAVWISRGRCRAMMGYFSDALGDFSRGTATYLNEAAWHEYGLILLRESQFAKHAELCEKMLRLLNTQYSPDTQDEDLCVWICLLRHSPERTDPILKLARRLAELKENATRNRNLGVALYRAGKFEEAVEQLTASVSQNEDFPSAWLFLSMAHFGLGENAESDQWLKKASNWLMENTDTLSWDKRLELNLLVVLAQREPDFSVREFR